MTCWPRPAITGAGRHRPGAGRLRLHWSPTGGLAVDAEAVTGGSTAPLTVDPAGCRPAVVGAVPGAQGLPGAAAVAERPPGRCRTSCAGQLAVAAITTPPAGCSTPPACRSPGVLDDLYAGAAPRSDARRHLAPASADARAVGADRAERRPAGLARRPAAAAGRRRDRADAPRRRRRRGRCPAAALAGARYLYEVAVYAPTTGKVETNLVTDPYSVALTPNSTRVGAVDLADPALAAARLGDRASRRR